MSNLIPKPQREIIQEGILNKENGFCFKDEPKLDYLTYFKEQINYQTGGVPISFVQTKMPSEGYKLTVESQKVTIEASDERGFIWALVSLKQLLDQDETPCLAIEDYPQCSHRGVHLDCSRHFFKAEEVKKVLRAMNQFKLNVFHWHLSDDQGYRIESKVYPRLNEFSKDYYTQQEIRDVDAYAKMLGIEVIGEIDMPGHTTAILAAYPELGCQGKEVEVETRYGIFPIIMCAGKETTYTFVENLLNEVCPLFASNRFHIGGDEAPKREWNNCPDCQKKKEELHLQDMEQLQSYFTERVMAMIRKLGKTPICFNEVTRGNCKELPVVQYWTLAYRKEMEKFIEQGGQWIYSDMFELYFDYPHAMASLERVYHTVAHLKDQKAAKGLLGYECCLWCERVETNESVETHLFPRAVAVAETAWNKTDDYADFKARLKQQKMPVQMEKEENWDPKGSKRRKEAIDYFIKMNSGMDDAKSTTDDSNINSEFAGSFATKFFKPLDLPFLAAALLKKK